MSPLLHKYLTELLGLLRQTQPDRDNTDVAWHGPYFSPKAKLWGSTYFSLYEDALYCTVWLEFRPYSMAWKFAEGTIDFGSRLGLDFHNDEAFWVRVVLQLIPKLRSALKNPRAYQARIESRIPPACRSGKIQRQLTWGPARPRTSERSVQGFLNACDYGASRPLYATLSARRYLDTAALAYAAFYKHESNLSARERYRAHADGRHGGLLDLKPNNVKAFGAWLDSQVYAGAHPWEIMFAEPRGVLLSVHRESTQGMRFYLGAGTERLYPVVMRVALALARAHVAFVVSDAAEIAQALLGTDEVTVGGGRDAVYFDEIPPKHRNRIRFDPLPVITQLEEGQRERINRALSDFDRPSR